MYGTYVAPDAKAAAQIDDDLDIDDSEAQRSPALSAYGLYHQSPYGQQQRVQPASPASPAPVRLEPNRRHAEHPDAVRPGTGTTRPGTASSAGGYVNLQSNLSGNYEPTRAFGLGTGVGPGRGRGAPLRGRMTHFVQSFRSPIGALFEFRWRVAGADADARALQIFGDRKCEGSVRSYTCLYSLCCDH
jgi:hypothetical protein